MNNKFSLIALIVCYLLMCATAFWFYPKWKQTATEATLSWDVNGYYAYLPAIFIYKDLKHLAFRDNIMQQYTPSVGNYAEGNYDSVTTNYKLRYSCGQAVVMAPWFLMAHVYASNSSKYKADGYSLPYQFAIGLGMFLFAILGMWFLRKVLLYYFSDAVVAFSLLILLLGTNYLNYSSIDQAMTHSTLFTLYSMLLYVTISYYKVATKAKAILLGCLIGLLMLIRPPELIALIIPTLWGISNAMQLQLRVRVLLQHWKHVLLIALCIGLFASVQMAYGYYISNNIFYNGYAGYSYDWLRPHFIDYCLSPRAGWLLYCPVMLLSAIGFFTFIKQKQNIYAVVLFCIITFYLVCAWQVWWYGGRAMVQYYPLIIFFIASLLQVIAATKIWKIIFMPFVLLMCYINLWWTYMSHNGKIRVSETSYAYYMATIGKWTEPNDAIALIDNPDGLLLPGTTPTTILKHNFITDSNKYFLLSPRNIYTPSVKLPVFNKDVKKVFIDASNNYQMAEGEEWKMPQFYIKFYKKGVAFAGNMCRIGREPQVNVLHNVTLKASLPSGRIDSSVVYFWNADSYTSTEIYSVKAYTFTE